LKKDHNRPDGDLLVSVDKKTKKVKMVRLVYYDKLVYSRLTIQLIEDGFKRDKTKTMEGGVVTSYLKDNLEITVAAMSDPNTYGLDISETEQKKRVD